MTDAGRLEVACRAAREAGRIALAHLGDPEYFKLKGRRDLLIGASLTVQAKIREILLGSYPGDAFLGEEGPDDEPLPVGAENLWIVDPIDGSTNFFRGLPNGEHGPGRDRPDGPRPPRRHLCFSHDETRC